MKAWLLLLLLFAATANAAVTDQNARIDINDDGSSNWAVTLTYNETVQKSDYFVLSPIASVDVLADNVSVPCSVTYDIGSSIICNNLHAKEVVYTFHVKGLVDSIQKLKMFHYPFSVTYPIDHMNIEIKFPLGAALVDEDNLKGTGLKPYEPDFARQSSDGRYIFISWSIDKPSLGQTINVSVIYEIVSGLDTFTLFALILTAIVVAFIILLFFVFKKQSIKDILPVLTDGERKVMEILLREKGTVDQRVIVKETDFSKAKVSRVIGDLMHRGLVEKISKGRKNLIKLKKEIKQPEMKSEKKES